MGMPPNRVGPGRPKKLRRLEHNEVVPPRGTRMTRKHVTAKCSGYEKYGHNLTTCFRGKQENLVRLYTFW